MNCGQGEFGCTWATQLALSLVVLSDRVPAADVGQLDAGASETGRIPEHGVFAPGEAVAVRVHVREREPPAAQGALSGDPQSADADDAAETVGVFAERHHAEVGLPAESPAADGPPEQAGREEDLPEDVLGRPGSAWVFIGRRRLQREGCFGVGMAGTVRCGDHVARHICLRIGTGNNRGGHWLYYFALL